jgi:hypothetical protein
VFEGDEDGLRFIAMGLVDHARQTAAAQATALTLHGEIQTWAVLSRWPHPE